MINQDKWIDSLPKFNEEKNQLDPNKWVNTISKPNTYGSIKKYSLATILFVCGLLLVSIIKNETRNLQKEINKLEASINVLRFNLDQGILDNEVITSPENISLLAKKYLDTDLAPYKKSQIRRLNGKTKTASLKNKDENLSNEIKSKIYKKIEKKKVELKKLQELYSKPEGIPGELKTQVAKKIEEKKIELKNLYSSPKEAFMSTKAQKWVAVQVVKVFLGIPVVPGK
tara:strand:- start:140 stop:823 length:684 start_codon:yes stop_codon:yes gene_type:complete